VPDPSGPPDAHDPGKTASAVDDFYSRWAAVYDRVATLPPVGRWRERAVDALALAPGDTVLDVGTGTGANLPYLRERVGRSGCVVGVDLSSGAVERARARVEHAGWENVRVLRADATRPPVAAADAVLGTFVLGMFPDPATAVERWCDVVRPGGRVATMEATRRSGIGAPLNPAFELFVRAGAPSGGGATRRSGRSASAALDARVRTAHAALSGRTVDRHHERFVLGFVDVVAGTVPASRGVAQD
jgi:ubiquinone/menaquinone biosynthesis C-methylase UbiE